MSNESEPLTPSAWAAWIARLHAAPGEVVIAITGGGSAAISRLLEVPGASRTLLEATVPYANAALSTYLRAVPERFCSERTARAMAMVSYQRAIAYRATPETLVFGIGATASLASDRPKRGAHRVHVAVQSRDATWATTLVLEKGARNRTEEEALAADLILRELGVALSVECDFALPLRAKEAPQTRKHVAAPEWAELLDGRAALVAVGSAAPPRQVIFPGAFNPLHVGHRRMAERAREILQQPLAFELSILNVDKPPLDFLEIADRLGPLKDQPLWLTRAARFVEKSALFPGATFVVGADTIARIVDPRYYGGDPQRMEAAIAQLAERDCRFLVFGRLRDNQFRTADELPLPEALRRLCQPVPAEEFREDVSSTALRRQSTMADEE